MQFNHGMSTYTPCRAVRNYRPYDYDAWRPQLPIEIVKDTETPRSPFGDPQVFLDKMLKPDTPVDSDPLNFLSDKARLKDTQIHLLLQHMAARHAISYDIKRAILYEEAAIETQLERFRKWPSDRMLNPKRESDLEKQLQRLSQEKWAEEVACWRDTGRLASEIMELWNDYADHSRKARMMDLGL